uniref:Uncharacterized protein n=1 Tax=Setaria italica TaxID=4555 RepID=K3YF48_SETIT
MRLWQLTSLPRWMDARGVERPRPAPTCREVDHAGSCSGASPISPVPSSSSGAH